MTGQALHLSETGSCCLLWHVLSDLSVNKWRLSGCCATRASSALRSSVTCAEICLSLPNRPSMVQFQSNLENARLPEWAPQYVNYSLLKLKLKDIIAVKDNAELDQVCQARKFIFQGTQRAHKLNHYAKSDASAMRLLTPEMSPSSCSLHAFLTLISASDQPHAQCRNIGLRN